MSLFLYNKRKYFIFKLKATSSVAAFSDRSLVRYPEMRSFVSLARRASINSPVDYHSLIENNQERNIT